MTLILDLPRLYSSVVRAADCRSAGPWFKFGYALLSCLPMWRATYCLSSVAACMATYVWVLRGVGQYMPPQQAGAGRTCRAPRCGDQVCATGILARAPSLSWAQTQPLPAILLVIPVSRFISWLRYLPNMTVWPSGLRRWLQAPVRKGVGSNPTAVSLC